MKQIGANTSYVTYIVKGPTSTQNISKSLTCKLSDSFPNLIVVQVFRTVSKIENGISSTQSAEKAMIKGMEAKVKDVRFVDDAVLMIAISGQSQ